MLSRETFDHLLANVFAPLEDRCVAVLVCDATQPDPIILRANDVFTALSLYPSNDALGRHPGFLEGPLSEPGALLALFQTARGGARASGTLVLYRRDATCGLSDVVVSPIADETGALRYFTMAFQDLHALDSVAAPNRRVRFMVLPDGGLVSDNVAHGSPADWLDRIPATFRARLSHAARCCAAAGAELIKSVRLANSLGVETDAMLRACRLPDPARPDCLVYEGTLCAPSSGMILSERLRLLEAVMANANDVIIVTEADPFELPGPRILYVNDAIIRHTGYKPAQLLGKTPRALQGPDTDREATARFGATLRRWERCTATLLNYRADNSTFWNEISCTPIADEHGWWTHWIAIQRDITERKEAEQKVAFLADHDPLTGLANRRLASGRLSDGLGQLDSGQAACGVVKIDLDRFKPVNDTYGHAAGDAVLEEVAKRLRTASRGTDTIARIGGDEFLVVMPGISNRPDLEAAATRFLAGLTGPFRWNGRKLAIEASVGAALYPDDADGPEGLLAAADAALYRAKARGRGRAHVFNDDLRAETAELRRIGEDLHDAIEQDDFIAFFQPKVNLLTRRLVGFEALVRWRHPTMGLLRPPSFLAVAEAGGLMRTIDTRMARQVAEAAAKWQAAGFDFGRVAINASADSFADPAFVATLRDTVTRAGMNPRHLTVEVVESIFISDRAGGVVAKLEELRQFGIRIELDDFGTGYAALAHLRACKVDGIKLDRSFVSRLGENREDEIIASAIIGLARNLDISCVAEGIETERQVAFLRELSCENGQGYLFGMPADEAATTALLHRLHASSMVVADAEPVLA